MVKTNGIALWVLTGMSVCTDTEQARSERSLMGRKITKADQIRVQQARLNRLEERIEKMSADGAFLAERARQHREMRLKNTSDLRQKVADLKAKLEEDRERMQKEFERQLTTVREEMWAQAARDRDALEAELEARHEGEREKLLEEARERASAMVEEVKAKMAAEVERDRELYARRAASAEEGQEVAREGRQQLQEEKDELARQLQEAMEAEDANRKKIIIKFKNRETTLRKNFEAQLREVRAMASGPASGAGAPKTVSKRPRKVTRPTSSSTNGLAGEASQRAPLMPSSSGTSPNSGSGGASSVSTSGSPAKTPQR